MRCFNLHLTRHFLCLLLQDSFNSLRGLIGNAVWVGSNVTILPGTKVGDGVIVQAGSVVHGSLQDYGIYGGNPAKLIKKRENSEKCRSLISTGCYIKHK